MKRVKEYLLKHPSWVTAAVNLLTRTHRVTMGPDAAFISVRAGNDEVRIRTDNAAYLTDVVREFEYYFSSVEPELHAGRRIADFSLPRLHRLPGVELPFAFPGLPEGRETNDAYLEWLALGEGSVVLDIGAYAGLTAYHFAKVVGPTGRVVAVEADPRSHDILSANVHRAAAMGIHNIIVKHVAIWKEHGSLAFESEGNMGAAVSARARRGGNTVHVPAVTLDELITQCSLERVDGMKMDIEGAEYDVLPAAGAFLRTYRPRVVVEVHYDERGCVNVGAIARVFEASGYTWREVEQSQKQRFPLLFAKPNASGA